MRVLITGADGQLGKHLLRCAPDSISVRGTSRAECDITHVDEVREACRAFEPDVVINAAAYTAVDKAETEQQKAVNINVTGAGNVGQVSSEFSARTIHVSTDYVFDGRASSPYQPNARTNPLNIYGITKLKGERAVSLANTNSLIVRTGWVYSARQSSFVGKILSRLNESSEVRVVQDQTGVPTSSTDLATALWAAVRTPSLRGIYHWVNSGTASWYEFAVQIRERATEIGLVRETSPIVAVPSSDFRSAAVRPAYSVLDATAMWAALGQPARGWREALEDVLRELPRPATRKP